MAGGLSFLVNATSAPVRKRKIAIRRSYRKHWSDPESIIHSVEFLPGLAFVQDDWVRACAQMQQALKPSLKTIRLGTFFPGQQERRTCRCSTP